MKVEDETNVTKLPVKFKEQAPPERTLVVPYEVKKAAECGHLMATYIVNEAEAEVECGRCGTRLNPMWVLRQLATTDRRHAEARAAYQDEQRRLAERSRTKCEHCKQMTRISRR